MRAALLDLDETILDRTGSLHDFVSWQANGMLRASIDNPSRFIERFIALDKKGMVWIDQVYESLVEEFQITDWSVSELLDSYLLTFCAFCKPRAGALAAIEVFRSQNFKIGLVTNGKTPFQERNFQALGIHEQFVCVIVKEAVGLRKPDKVIYELACSRLNADIGSSVLIGDNPVADIEGAKKKTGMQTIYVPVTADHEACAYADVTCCDMTDLLSYIGREFEH